MSEANAVRVIAAPEVDYGVVPTGAAYTTFRWTAERFTGTPRVARSQEVRNDRGISDQFITGLDVTGAVDYELTAGTYDEYMEAAMHGTWTTDVLRVGTLDRSFSIQKSYTDFAAGQNAILTGNRVSQWNLDMAYGSPVTGLFSFVGNGIETDTASLINTGTINAPTTTEVFNASADFGSFMIDGNPSTVCAKSANLRLNNNFRPIECMGALAPTDQSKGTALVEIDIEAYLDEGAWALYEKVLIQESTEFEFTLTNGAQSYSFYMPNLKLTGEMPQATGLDTDVMLSLSGVGLVDGSGDSLVVTRVT